MFVSREKKTDRILNILANSNLSADQILQESRDKHGFFHGLWTGNLYSLLISLEDDGRIYSFWKEGTHPRKRLYAKAENEKS